MNYQSHNGWSHGQPIKPVVHPHPSQQSYPSSPPVYPPPSSQPVVKKKGGCNCGKR
ncbi:MAG: hypothetical protein ACRC5C_00510 [Bacilli bacterium]